MTTRDYDCNDYDDDDAEDNNNNNNNNNSKDDEIRRFIHNFRPNNGTALNDVEEEEEEEASIKERARKLKNRLEAEVLEEQRWREALESDDISKRRKLDGRIRGECKHDVVRAKSGSSRSSASRFATSTSRQEYFLAKWKKQGMCE